MDHIICLPNITPNVIQLNLNDLICLSTNTNINLKSTSYLICMYLILICMYIWYIFYL